MIAPGTRPDGKMEDAARLAAERVRRFRDDPEPSFASRLGQIGVLGWAIVAPILHRRRHRPLARLGLEDRHFLHRAAHHARRGGGPVDRMAMDAPAMMLALHRRLRRAARLSGPRISSRCGGASCSCATAGRRSASPLQALALRPARGRARAPCAAGRRAPARRGARGPRGSRPPHAAQPEARVKSPLDPRAAVSDRPGRRSPSRSSSPGRSSPLSPASRRWRRAASASCPRRPRRRSNFVVSTIDSQIRDTMQSDPAPFRALIGSIFLFVLVSNWSSLIPGVEPATAHIETDAAMALIIFVATVAWGVRSRGLAAISRPSPSRAG